MRILQCTAVSDQVVERNSPCRQRSGGQTQRAAGRNSVNYLAHEFGKWHDAEQSEADRKLSALHPHMLRHTFAFRFAQATHADEYELQRRPGHQSKTYLQVYTNPPEEIAAGHIKEF